MRSRLHPLPGYNVPRIPGLGRRREGRISKKVYPVNRRGEHGSTRSQSGCIRVACSAMERDVGQFSGLGVHVVISTTPPSKSERPPTILSLPSFTSPGKVGSGRREIGGRSPKTRWPFGGQPSPKGRVSVPAQAGGLCVENKISALAPKALSPSAAVGKPSRWADGSTSHLGINP